MIRIEERITGYLVGPLWMPGVEAFKEVSYDVTREAQRYTDKPTLRDHVLAVTNDGDFQHCALAHAWLVVSVVTDKPGRHTERTRYWPMEAFQSVADMVDADWAGPSYNEED